MRFQRRTFRTIVLLAWLSAPFAWPSLADAGTVKLMWDRNPERQASYIVAYGTEPGTYTVGIDVGRRIATTVTNLQDGVRYYFVVYAYIHTSISRASGEVSTVAQPGSSPPSNWRPRPPGPAGPNNAPAGNAAPTPSTAASTPSDASVGVRETADCGPALTPHVEAGDGSTFVPGDYDGDGSVDCAVWRAGVGVWRVLPSSAGFNDYLDIPIGGSEDVAVPADYDGDGRTDVAVWNSVNGIWSIKTSSTSFTDGFSVQWGTSSDLPTVGDYDGDGRADLGIWQPANATFAFRLSHGNYAPTDTLTLPASVH